MTEDGMMFPKRVVKKRKKKHKASILHDKDGTCYLCMELNHDRRRYLCVHEHHIYGGALRPVSEAEGFKVYLCLAHHIDGPEAVHNNQGNMRFLQRECQRKYEETHTRQQFMSLINKNYMED